MLNRTKERVGNGISVIYSPQEIDEGLKGSQRELKTKTKILLTSSISGKYLINLIGRKVINFFKQLSN